MRLTCVGLLVAVAVSCLKQPAPGSDTQTDSSNSRAVSSSQLPSTPPTESTTGEFGEWISSVNKPCAGDPSPRWDPNALGALPIVVDGGFHHADRGVAVDASASSTITDTWHESVDQAKAQAEFEHTGTLGTWIEVI
jgi:hypothetical protein